MKLVWMDEAFFSLKDIHEYISRNSEHYALLTVERILSHESTICTCPLLGLIVPEYSDESIREFIEGNYRIIYHIVSNDLIEVITIVHVARNL